MRKAGRQSRARGSPRLERRAAALLSRRYSRMTSQSIAPAMLQISIPRTVSKSSRSSGNSMVTGIMARRADARDQQLGDHRVTTK